jgi:hypothetical protein
VNKDSGGYPVAMNIIPRHGNVRKIVDRLPKYFKYDSKFH